MPNSLERNNELGLDQYPLRFQDFILRALAKAKSEFINTTGREPRVFMLTSVAFADLESKFPENYRGTQRVFFGMIMRKNDDIGLTDDQFELAE